MHETFSLVGGPLHRIGRRLGLVRGTNTVRLGLVLGVGLWLLVFALALVEGVTDQLFKLSFVGGHVRLLVVIPLFFICESWVGPAMAAFVGTIARTGLVPPGATASLDAEVARAGRWTNWWGAEAVCLLVAIVLEATGSRLQTYGVTGAYDRSATSTSMAALVYFGVGVTLFRFLLFRWAWKLALWCWFLWRVSRLDLHLIPGHPDRAGGLGSLQSVYERFTPLVIALSALVCASLSESIAIGTLAATAVYPTLGMLLLMDGALFLAPLLVFTDKLWAGRTKGMAQYMSLAARYVTEFEAKWTGANAPAGVSVLGTQDLQSLADLDNTISIVKGMRWITIGPRLLTMLTMAAIVPLTPLVLFQYPLTELAAKFFSRLAGF